MTMLTNLDCLIDSYVYCCTSHDKLRLPPTGPGLCLRRSFSTADQNPNAMFRTVANCYECKKTTIHKAMQHTFGNMLAYVDSRVVLRAPQDSGF